MKKRDINPVLKFLLELGPLVIFFIISRRDKRGYYKYLQSFFNAF